ncbi:hypothetical protein GR7B_00048 [Vibrio phage vB_VcorM_GR7B]|nr:hypothetical protein GR7B_00048 [Vibrio phage vB_VcorM_GR7B]
MAKLRLVELSINPFQLSRKKSCLVGDLDKPVVTTKIPFLKIITLSHNAQMHMLCVMRKLGEYRAGAMRDVINAAYEGLDENDTIDGVTKDAMLSNIEFLVSDEASRAIQLLAHDRNNKAMCSLRETVDNLNNKRKADKELITTQQATLASMRRVVTGVLEGTIPVADDIDVESIRPQLEQILVTKENK